MDKAENTASADSPQSQTPPASTLIEFPGVGRNARPQWRKELSERVREIQQRRAREAALEAEEAEMRQHEAPPVETRDSVAASNTAEAAAKQLGLVPPPPSPPELNPIVAAALRRIERARQQTAAAAQTIPRSGSSRSMAATAVARVAEENYAPSEEQKPSVAVAPLTEELQTPAGEQAKKLTEERVEASDATRAASLVVVTPSLPAKPVEPEVVKTRQAEEAPATEIKVNVATPATNVVTVEKPSRRSEASVAGEVQEEAQAQPQARRPRPVIDEMYLDRNGIELLPKVASPHEAYDDRAPLQCRVLGALVDLVVVGFISAPFAAVIELTIGNWGDPLVIGSLAGIVAVVMFLYLTCSTALAGRTFGMSLFSMHTVDADSALAPTTWQCIRRAVVYMVSLVTLGIGILYALFDAEGRTAHDYLSGTVVVRG